MNGLGDADDIYPDKPDISDPLANFRAGVHMKILRIKASQQMPLIK
jgi:hypothetical protein